MAKGKLKGWTAKPGSKWIGIIKRKPKLLRPKKRMA